MTNLIATDVQGSQIDSGVIELFELTKGSTTYYFHPGLNENLTDVKFRDKLNPGTINTYTAIPCQLDGLDISSSGASARPTLSLANVTSDLKTILSIVSYDDLVGSTLVRRTTLEKYLDDGSGDSANPPVELNSVKFVIDRISSENNMIIQFELAALFDLEGIQLPRRVTTGKYCSWMYQGDQLRNHGGCMMPLDSILYNEPTDGGTVYETNVFFNVKDEQLVQTAFLNTLSAWSSSASYTKSSFVSHGGKHYQSLATHTASASKSPTNDLYWREVHGFSTYSSSVAYAEGSLVLYTATINGKSVRSIWQSLHTSNLNNAPSPGSAHWERQDLCSKTLEGCKCRFQAIAVDYTDSTKPLSSAKQNKYALPFGSFPGTATY